MRIDALKKYQRRDRRDYFSDLSTPVRAKASEWLRRFCNRRGGNPPRWLFAIYVGQAKRLALNPPDSTWGRSMLAKRGGHAVQHRYRLEGRHPTEKATRRRLALQKARKAEMARLQASRPSQSQPFQPPHRIIEWHPPGPSLEARQLHKRLSTRPAAAATTAPGPTTSPSGTSRQGARRKRPYDFLFRSHPQR